MTPKKVIVCGGRDYANAALVNEVLSKIKPEIIIEGGANGADALARQWAKEHGVECRTYQADWKRHGKAAGPIRNQRMIDEEQPDLCVAFPGGSGTENMIGKCAKAGVKLFIVGDAGEGRIVRAWETPL